MRRPWNAHYRNVLCGAVLIGIVSILVYTNGVRDHWRADRLARALQEARLPAVTVYIDDAAYTVENGAVRDQAHTSVEGPHRYDALRIAYVFFGALIHPYFSLDGTNPSRFTDESKILFDSRDALAGLYTPEEGSTISNLYPEALLLRIPQLQEIRDSFIAQPSLANARRYLFEMEEFSALYVENAIHLTQVIRASSVDDDSVFFLADGHTTKQGLLSALDALRTSGIETQRTLREFISCSYGSGENCTSILHIQDMVQPTPAAALTHETFEAWRLIQNAFPERFNYHMVTLRTTNCALPQEAAAYGTWNVTSANNAQVHIRYVSDLYFWDISTQKHSENPSFQSLVKKGINYQYQNLNNPYICHTGSADYSGVVTALWARNELSTRPISNELPFLSASQRTALVRLEHTITQENEVLRMEHIEDYAYALHTIVREHIPSFTSLSLARALRFIATVEHRSASAHMLIRELSLYNYNLRDVNADRKSESGQHTIVSRHYIYPLFFSYNQSFIEHAPRISLYEEKNPLFEKLVSYRSALRQQLSTAQIEHIIRETREFYVQAAR